MNPFVALLFTLLLAAPAWAQQRPAPAEPQRAAPKVDAHSMLRALEDEFAYDGIQTCAADGSCAAVGRLICLGECILGFLSGIEGKPKQLSIRGGRVEFA